MKPLFATALIAGACTLSACDVADPFVTQFANDPAWSGNYAAEFCTHRGHSYEARQKADGSVQGVCNFKGGGSEDAFIYFRKNATGGSF